MSTALISHSAFLEHVTPPGHPERVDRMRAINAALEAEEFAYLVREDAPIVNDAEIMRAHPESYIRMLEERAPDQSFAALDADTFMSPHSLEAARRAAGAVVRAVDMVMAGETHNAFCYTYEGSARFGGDSGETLPAGSLGVLGDGDALLAHANGAGARFLLVAGKPINEPIARHGPFVMNTREEIITAVRDFQSGRFP